jgi:hypothetical protein
MALDAATPPPPSWLRFGGPPPVSPQTDAIFAATRGAVGYVRHQQRVLADNSGLGIRANAEALGTNR